VSEDEPEKRLRPGSRLILQDARGVPFEVVVEKLEEGTIVIDASDAPVESTQLGEPVLVEHRVSGDARYRARAQLDVDPAQGVRLLPIESWERDNQRSFVRVRTYGLDVTLSRPLEELDGDARSAGRKPARYPMLDVSAGGAAIRAEPRFELGEEVVCRFELPGECCFALPARVVRVDPPGSGRERGTVGVEFLGLDENHRAALLRWVFREQTKRRRAR
jgi:hypothetical protein